MTWQALVLLFGAVVQFSIGSMSYVRDTLAGKSKPNRMTFLMWSVGPFIGVIAGVMSGVVWWILLPVFMSGFGPFAIFISSFKNPNAYWQLHSFDYICGALAVLALVLWAITNNPIIAIWFAIASDAFASLPTIFKSWVHPETETGFAYFVAMCNVLLGLVLAPAYTFDHIGFLTYFFICDFILVVAIYRSRFFNIFRMPF